MNLADEFKKIEFDYTCPFCKEPIKVSLNQDKFNCPKCKTEFQTTLESKDVAFESHFVEEEDEQK